MVIHVALPIAVDVATDAAAISSTPLAVTPPLAGRAAPDARGAVADGRGAAPDGRGALLVCGLCGRGFREDSGQPTCLGCPLAGSCHFLRCPHCGFENPVMPGWLARVKGWFAHRVDSDE